MLTVPFPLILPLPVNLGLIGGIMCGGGILRGQGRMRGPCGAPEPRGPTGGAMGAMPRDLGPPGYSGSMPFSRDEPAPGLNGNGGGGGGGNLCL